MPVLSSSKKVRRKIHYSSIHLVSFFLLLSPILSKWFSLRSSRRGDPLAGNRTRSLGGGRGMWAVGRYVIGRGRLLCWYCGMKMKQTKTQFKSYVIFFIHWIWWIHSDPDQKKYILIHHKASFQIKSTGRAVSQSRLDDFFQSLAEWLRFLYSFHRHQEITVEYFRRLSRLVIRSRYTIPIATDRLLNSF